MEIFLDSADPREVSEVASQGLISGITTNPMLYATQARGVSHLERLRELIEVSPGPVFTQVIGTDDTEAMVRQARWLGRQSDKIIVKLPMTVAGIRAVIDLKRESPSIRLAVTAVSSVAQALIAGKAGADVVALFNGPLDLTSDTPVEIVAPVRQIYLANGFGTRILSACRFPRGVGEYVAAGSDMITLRKEFLGLLYEHPFTDKRLQGFAKDWAGAFGDATWPQE
jgi:transaldolase